MPIAAHMKDNPQAFEDAIGLIRGEEFRSILRGKYANDANAAEIALLVEKMMKSIFDLLNEIKSDMAKEATVKSESGRMRELIDATKEQDQDLKE